MPAFASSLSISNKELSELIEQLQKNADQVEKNIVDTEAKMQSVSARSPATPSLSWAASPVRTGTWLMPKGSAVTTSQEPHLCILAQLWLGRRAAVGSCRASEAVAVAQVVGSLPRMWETWMEVQVLASTASSHMGIWRVKPCQGGLSASQIKNTVV